MRFSIVTPVYNAEKYIARTVASVLAQSYCDWEHICVDDGSKDSSGVILDELAAKDKRIKVIHQSNGGEGAARNAALKVATGDWVVFLDADDLITPWALEEYARIVLKHPEALLAHLELIEFKGDDDPQWEGFKQGIGSDVRVLDISREIPHEMSAAHFFQFAYSRLLLKGLEYTSHYVGADRVFLMKCLVRADSVACSDAVSYAYRRIPTSITGTRITLRKLRDRQLYIKECIECVKNDERKRLAIGAIREFCNNLTECTVLDIGNLRKEDRNEAWYLWQGWLDWIATLERLTVWRRVTILACRYLSWMPFHIVPRVLLGVPRRLKLMGIHR